MKSVPLGKSYSTIYREINSLHYNNYISQGVKDGKFNTYYINQDGIEKLKEML
jgi:DNA-binding PadR family transcriptional regulator